MLTAITTFVTLAVLLQLPARKWELKSKHYLPWIFFVACLGAALSYAATIALPNVPSVLFVIASLIAAAITSVAAIMFFFFRDPERTSPTDPSLIVSPADGTVIYIKEIEDGRFPFAVKNSKTIPLTEFAHEDLIPSNGVQIGIAMNYLNVHVNRSPIQGVVKMLKPIGGAFISLKHIHALLENERTLMVFENENIKIGIVQIASRLVRRIVPYVQEGQVLEKGQRVGMIKFGSQVDLLVAYREDLKVQVKVGDEVIAGESIVMTCDPSIRSSTALSRDTIR
jgi:phosphatidylserine decarboxylase